MYYSENRTGTVVNFNIMEKTEEIIMPCCKDCKWIGVDEKEDEILAFGKGSYPLFCIPYIPPGHKFWEDEGSDNCGKADLSCEVGFHCPGVGVALGYITGEKCSGGRFTKIGAGSTKVGGGEGTWTVMYGEECLDPEWIKAGNDLCRSMHFHINLIIRRSLFFNICIDSHTARGNDIYS